MYILRLVLAVFFYFLSLSAIAGTDKPFTLVLDWFVNPNHAPILVADTKGIFQKHGLKVKIITPADPTDPPKWVAINRANIALDYQPHVIMEIAGGLPIKQVGTLVDHPLNCLVVLESSPFQKLVQLKGQTIAYSSPEIDLAILKRMLQHEGVALEDVKPINVHYNLTQSLLTGKTAAALGMMRNVELIQLKILGKPGRAFFPEDYGVPSYSELVFISKDGASDDRFEKFFAALKESNQYLQTHPLESYNEVIKKYPELNNDTNKAIWLNTVKQFSNDFAKVDLQQYAKVKAWLNTK